VTDGLRGATGVFGGTFDPIHVAHLAIAEAARDTFGLRRVLFIPAAEPPHKPDRQITPVEHRLAMVELALVGNAGFKVSRIEVDRPGPSYTVDTLEALQEIDGNDRFALILSAESFAELPTWHKPERILQLASVIVAPRDGYIAVDAAFVGGNVSLASAAAVFLDGPRIRLSASEIRERAAAGRSLRYLVPDAVAAYISDHALYQDPRRTDRS
jgi:nicotinate-nucleotide adenylyltransferase